MRTTKTVLLFTLLLVAVSASALLVTEGRFVAEGRWVSVGAETYGPGPIGCCFDGGGPGGGRR